MSRWMDEGHTNYLHASFPKQGEVKAESSQGSKRKKKNVSTSGRTLFCVDWEDTFQAFIFTSLGPVLLTEGTSTLWDGKTRAEGGGLNCKKERGCRVKQVLNWLACHQVEEEEWNGTLPCDPESSLAKQSTLILHSPLARQSASTEWLRTDQGVPCTLLSALRTVFS